MKSVRGKKIGVTLTNRTRSRSIGRLPMMKLAAAVCEKYCRCDAQTHIVIVGDKAMRLIHERFLRSGKTTDVISFDLSDRYESYRTFEIVINAAIARRRAGKNNRAVRAELALYLVHGLLHQFGFDDADSRQEQNMHRTEDRILQRAGFGPVYRQRPAGKDKRR